jgi:DNA-binding transcriptional LysR family regulator
MSISWRHIEFFDGIMSTGSTTQAAQLLRTSQPTVSRELRDLEEQLGFKLFERKGRRLSATAEAMQFHAEVRRSYAGLKQLVQAGQAIRDNISQSLQVACLPLFAQTLMPRVCERFGRLEQAARVSLHVVDQSILIGDVVSRRYDLGIVETGVAVEGLAVHRVGLGDEVAILPAGHPLCRKRRLKPADFHGERFISFSADDLYRRRFDTLFEQAGVERDLRIETTTAESICAMVERGIGVSIINPISAHAYRGRGLEMRRLSVSIPFVVGLCRPIGKAPSRLAERFAALVLDECARIQRELAAVRP